MLVRAVRRKANSQSNQEFSHGGFALKSLVLKKAPSTYRLSRLTSTCSVLQRHGFPQRSGLVQANTTEEYSCIPYRRQMATAFSFTSEDIPFENTNGPPLSMMGIRNNHGRFLRPNLSPPEAFGLGEKANSQSFRRGKLGISGDFSEIVPVFEACVYVGRLERARDILDKLHDKCLPEYDAIHCTNLYLQARVQQIMMSPKNENDMQDIHKWFMINYTKNSSPYDSETIAYMLRLSLMSDKNKRDPLIRRYMNTLDEDSFLELIEADVLTGHEIGLITEIYPDFNFTLEPSSETLDENPTVSFPSAQRAKDFDQARILETKQKGLGLSTLKRTLSLFDDFASEGIDFETADNQLKRELQRRLEEDAVTAAIERWREEHESLIKIGVVSNLKNKTLGSQMWEWQIALEKKIHAELALITKAETTDKKSRDDIDRCLYGPLLQILPPSQSAAVAILTAMTMMGQHTDKRTPLTAIVLEIGKNIEDESALFMLQKKFAQKENEVEPAQKKPRLNLEFYVKLRRSRGAGAVARHMNSHFADEGAKSWPALLKAKIGAVLMSNLIEVAKVTACAQHPETKEELFQTQPAFTHAHQYKRGKKTGVILPNKVILEQLQREPVHSLLAKQLPMIVQPEKWTSFRKGGYIAHPCSIMRIKLGDHDQRHYCEAAIAQGDMSTVLEGLNVLGKTSWRINNAVFKVMVEAWNMGEAIANFPSTNPQISIPPEPLASTDPLERGRWIRQVKVIGNIKTGLHSQRCFQNFQLEIARGLLGKEFYFPHNIDFRGRAYPIPPYLNHIGADHCRGILMFGKGKELGMTGLRWLKIHLSNVFGFDKASLQEREDFTNSNIEEISDSARNPMTGNRWWLKSENPWQCLAACIELRNALDCTDPSKYVSHLPVHQDGTCNGLQHYAALGGDVWGAKQVNLEPGERPADVYTAVSQLVQQGIMKDKKLGIPMATYLEGKISRKTVKQTVMTNVYGVTFIGASAQVRKQLAVANPDLSKSENSNRQNASAYVARKIFSGLSTMFRGAHDIQNWLGECATRITTSINPQQLLRLESGWENLSSPPVDSLKRVRGTRREAKPLDPGELTTFKSGVIWTSPLGMPVVQPYRTAKGKLVRTSMQNFNISEPQKNSPVNKRKQLQGFPPNFIHSLDASHMILSAIGCDKLGLSFAAVHDSFWTHPSDIDTMNKVLREKFVEIHNDDIIGRLAAEFKTRYQNSMYLARIKPGISTKKAIAAWRSKMRTETNKKFKSSNADRKTLYSVHELLIESKRHRLLSSSDPNQINQGKKMETPRSIYEASGLDVDETISDDSVDPGEDLVPIENTAGQNSGISINSEDLESILHAAHIDPESIEFSASFDEDTGEESQDESENINYQEDEKLSRFEKVVRISPMKKNPIVDLIWLPLTFPEIPKKGDFDVNRVMDSKYFFS